MGKIAVIGLLDGVNLKNMTPMSYVKEKENSNNNIRDSFKNRGSLQPIFQGDDKVKKWVKEKINANNTEIIKILKEKITNENNNAAIIISNISPNKQSEPNFSSTSINEGTAINCLSKHVVNNKIKVDGVILSEIQNKGKLRKNFSR